jgi:hypothetical protein
MDIKPIPVGFALNLRDHIAIAAMQGLLANTRTTDFWDYYQVARAAYSQADAMLEVKNLEN